MPYTVDNEYKQKILDREIHKKENKNTKRMGVIK